MYKSILLPIDLNEESSWKRALPTAEKLARSENAQLHIFTVIPDFGMSIVGSFFPADHSEKALKETEAEIKKFVAAHVSDDISAQSHVRHGIVYKEIIHEADALGCDLIVLSSHRPETKDYLLGPNAARVVRHASQSVFVVRD